MTDNLKRQKEEQRLSAAYSILLHKTCGQPGQAIRKRFFFFGVGGGGVVDLFFSKALINETITFTSPTQNGTAILRGHPSHAKV